MYVNPFYKFGILLSEILHVPDLWIFRALKIRQQIGVPHIDMHCFLFLSIFLENVLDFIFAI